MIHIKLKHHKEKNIKGFTLLELMVVITIIGLLIAIVAPNILGNQDKAMMQKAKADIASLEQSLDLYRLDNFTYPTTAQGLEALVTKPTIAPEPKQYSNNGYIRRLPTDPWGNPYMYVRENSNTFIIKSYGADGKEGGEGSDMDIFLK